MMAIGMNDCGLGVTGSIRIPLRTIVLGVLFALGAPAVRAQPEAPATTLPSNPAAAQLSIDLALHPAATAQSAPIDSPLESASEEVRRVVRWVVDSGDNAGLPYLLVDKVNAQVFAFNAAGQLQGAAPSLLGMARGDRLLAPNSATMAEMSPQMRITPAGRFVSRLAIDSDGKELLVLDYDASISLHPVIKGTPAEHRAERLRSPTSQDNRISYGCINVPPEFYTTVVSPAFAHTRGIVYVLPETVSASALFGLNPVRATTAGTQRSSPASNMQGSRAATSPAAAPR